MIILRITLNTIALTCLTQISTVVGSDQEQRLIDRDMFYQWQAEYYYKIYRSPDEVASAVAKIAPGMSALAMRCSIGLKAGTTASDLSIPTYRLSEIDAIIRARINLDPQNLFHDHQLWEAIETIKAHSDIKLIKFKLHEASESCPGIKCNTDWQAATKFLRLIQTTKRVPPKPATSAPKYPMTVPELNKKNQ